jgi:tRNA pseudouridine55 synthase
MSDPLHGVLVLDKPSGITSMTAVAMVRRRAGGVKTGHAGTLDPLATGVLVIALGHATRSIDRLMATDKRYRTAIDLSAFTTTDDLEGERSEVAVAQPPSMDAVRTALHRFIGEVRQRPPAFSAVKVAGQRAYKLARKGEAPVIEPRLVFVYELSLVNYAWPRLELDIRCAKGFYVRSLARDLGEALGVGGHCVSIRRTAVGPFTLEMSKRPDDLPERLSQSDLIPLETALTMVGE